MRTVLLSDASGTVTGECDLIDAHTGNGRLHKAFSVYVFRKKGSEILMQKRSREKMLWPLIWANTCCSHPRKDETPSAAGERRLLEEFGFTLPLHESTSFVYRAEDPTGRGVEHEHVTILTGNTETDLAISPDPREIAEWKWMPLDTLRKELQQHPDSYAPWFHLGLAHLIPHG